MEELVLVLLQFERMLVLELLPWYFFLVSWGSVAVARVGGRGSVAVARGFIFRLAFIAFVSM